MRFLYVYILMAFFLSCSDNSNNQPEESNDIVCDSGNTQSIEMDFVFNNDDDINSFLELNVTEVIGTISINGISDISFLSCLKKVNSIGMSFCPIENLNALSSLEEIQSIYLYNCEEIEDFEGIGNISTINFLSVRDCDSFMNFKGLSSLNSIVGLEVRDNESLLNLDGLSSITENILTEDSMSGRIDIIGNPNLLSVTALNNISGVLKSSFEISNCSSLTYMGDFDEVTKLDGGLVVGYCPNLQAIDCFPNVSYSSLFSFYENTSLSNIAFPSLTKSGYLEIENNANLNLLEFENLTEISGTSNGDFGVMIDGNDSLTNLNGFMNWTVNEFIVEINTGYLDFENPLTNICGLRKLVVENISTGTFDNALRFKSSCYGYLGGTLDINQFDANCECS